MYESINLIGNYVQWMIGAAIAIITFRVVYIIHSMSTSQDENNASFNSIAEKVSKHIKGLIIAVIIETVIEVFQAYYIH